MLFTKKIFYPILFICLFFACSSDDDNGIEAEDPIEDEELVFDFKSSDRNFGNAYISFEGNQFGINYYRLQIVPPGVTFDPSSSVFSGGSTGDYVSFDFKVPETEDFLIDGDYEVDFSATAFTVEGVLYENVEITLDSADAIPMVLTVPGSEAISLQIDENSFTIDVDVMATKASPAGVDDVEVIGDYSSGYEMIDLND